MEQSKEKGYALYGQLESEFINERLKGHHAN